MLAKIWKKLLLFILIVACVFNVTIKLVTKVPLAKEINSVVEYVEYKTESK